MCISQVERAPITCRSPTLSADISFFYLQLVDTSAHAQRWLQAALAGGEAWTEYFQLFNESRFVHVTSLDFAALCLSAPFWMWNDAEKRQWQDR